MKFFIDTANIEEIKENNTTFFCLKDKPMAKKVNIVTALTTEADNPATKANIQSKTTITQVFTILPLLIRSNGFSNQDKIHIKTPTCKPETAKICIAPAFE